MTHYDPEQPPEPERWLALDEQERIQLAEGHHRQHRITLPNAKAHAVFHVIVENQIAEGLESVVHAVHRLAHQGLSRHDSLHAIGWVLSQHSYEVMNATEDPDPIEANAQYEAAVERLDAKAWRAAAEG